MYSKEGKETAKKENEKKKEEAVVCTVAASETTRTSSLAGNNPKTGASLIVVWNFVKYFTARESLRVFLIDGCSGNAKAIYKFVTLSQMAEIKIK